MNSFRIKQNGTNVLVIHNGVLLCEIPWQVALELAESFKIVGHLAESFAKQEQIVQDQALLLRKGFPLDLTINPNMLHEAYQEAYWNRDLRKIPKALTGIPSEEKVGRPK